MGIPFNHSIHIFNFYRSSPKVESLLIYPIKSLCGIIFFFFSFPLIIFLGIPVEKIDITVGQGLKYDREWAIMDEKNLYYTFILIFKLLTHPFSYVNGKHYPAVHKIRLHSFKAPSTITLSYKDKEREFEEVSFDLFKQKSEVEEWFRQIFKKKVYLVHKKEGIYRYNSFLSHLLTQRRSWIFG